jgi:dienelactone hydrolase
MPPPARKYDIRQAENRQRALNHGEKRFAALRQIFRERLGIPAQQSPRRVREISRVELTAYTRIEYHVETEPDCIVNLTWLLPHGFVNADGQLQPLPTVLCLPGSSSDVARDERNWAHEVPARGWNAVQIDARVALYPFHPGIGERRAMIAQSVHDLLTCCAWVFEQPGIDPLRVGCMGVSQGGTHSWMLPALEPRIAAAAPVCGICTYRSLIDNVRDERYDSVWRSFLDSHSIYYFVPGVLSEFEQQDLCALIAPRPLAFIGADHDNCFPLDGMREAAADLRDWYRLFGAEKNFRYVEFRGEHSMPAHSRQTAYQFLGRAFARVAGL